MPGARYAPEPTHANLSDAAKRLAPDALAGEALRAELLLQLGAYPDPTDERAEVTAATLAVVTQINFQVAQGPGAGAIGSETKGPQSVVFARDPRTGEAVVLSPSAWQMREALFAALAAAEPVPEPTVDPPNPGGFEMPPRIFW